MNENEKAYQEQLRHEVEDMASRIPKAHSGWGVIRTVAFKDAIKDARAVLNRKHASIEALQSARNKLSPFFEEEVSHGKP